MTKSIDTSRRIIEQNVNQEQLDALNQAKLEKLNTEEVVNEELLDSLIAALNFKENQNLEEAIDIFDSSFKVKSNQSQIKRLLFRLLQIT